MIGVPDRAVYLPTVGLQLINIRIFATPLEFEQNSRRHIGDNAATIPTCLRQLGDKLAISRRVFCIREHSANGYEYFISNEFFVAVVATVVSQSTVASQIPTSRQTAKNGPEFVCDTG